MKVTDIDIHRVTLQYDEARAYELIHYHDLTQRTIYVAHTDSGLIGLGESDGGRKTGGAGPVHRLESIRLVRRRDLPRFGDGDVRPHG